ncbi:MAG: hypothetical protein M1834_005984 [Cirrosporium novae-zelandiae]|nr:MAG: hypothetical protein M1834_005984 [Cirrosporium novae-zelandiae]
MAIGRRSMSPFLFQSPCQVPDLVEHASHLDKALKRHIELEELSYMYRCQKYGCRVTWPRGDTPEEMRTAYEEKIQAQLRWCREDSLESESDSPNESMNFGLDAGHSHSRKRRAEDMMSQSLADKRPAKKLKLPDFGIVRKRVRPQLTPPTSTHNSYNVSPIRDRPKKPWNALPRIPNSRSTHPMVTRSRARLLKKKKKNMKRLNPNLKTTTKKPLS